MNDITKTPVSFKTRVLENEQVRAAFAVATEAQEKYITQLSEIEDLRYPQAKADRFRAAMGKMRDAAEIAACREEILRWSGDAAKLGASRAKMLAEGFQKDFAATLPGLLDAAEAALKPIHRETIESEKQLFEAYGLPYEQTAISRAVEKIQSQISSFRASLEPPPRLLATSPRKNDYSTLLDFFRIEE